MKKPEHRSPTILDVARVARVGRMTVSRVINDSPAVRPSTRRRVLAAIAQLGYQQNEAARMLQGKRAKMIGLIVPDLSDAFFASCAHTVQHIAHDHGYMTLVASSERDIEAEIAHAQLMASRKLSGILMVTSTHGPDERLLRLQRTGLPIVAFDRPIEGIQTDCVVVENRQGAEVASQHLIEHGHRNIACVGYDETTYTTRERVAGYQSAMRAANYKPNVAVDLNTFEKLTKWITKACKGSGRTTAILMLNAVTSIWILRALAEVGLSVPDDVALIGFDDFELAPLLSTPLTTVAQSPVAIASRAMVLLLDRINRSGTQTDIAKIVLPMVLIVRNSCGCEGVTGSKM